MPIVLSMVKVSQFSFSLLWSSFALNWKRTCHKVKKKIGLVDLSDDESPLFPPNSHLLRWYQWLKQWVEEAMPTSVCPHLPPRLIWPHPNRNWRRVLNICLIERNVTNADEYDCYVMYICRWIDSYFWNPYLELESCWNFNFRKSKHITFWPSLFLFIPWLVVWH